MKKRWSEKSADSRMLRVKIGQRLMVLLLAVSMVLTNVDLTWATQADQNGQNQENAQESQETSESQETQDSQNSQAQKSEDEAELPEENGRKEEAEENKESQAEENNQEEKSEENKESQPEENNQEEKPEENKESQPEENNQEEKPEENKESQPEENNQEEPEKNKNDRTEADEEVPLEIEMVPEEVGQEKTENTEENEAEDYGCIYIPERVSVNLEYGDKSGSFYICLYNNNSKDYNITISSSNTDVVKINKKKEVLKANNSYQYFYVNCTYVDVGSATINIKVGDYTYEVPTYLYKLTDGYYPTVKSVTQKDYNTLQIKWKSVSQYSGYYIKRALPDSYEYETVATVRGGKKSSANLDVKEWGNPYDYTVIGYMQSGDDYFEPTTWNNSMSFTMEKIGASITTIKKAGNNKIRIAWESASGAEGYRLYRSTEKNGTYKRVYSGKNKVTEYTDTVKAGVTYYYKLKTVYPEFTSKYSATISKMLPKSGKATSRWLSLSGNPYIWEQYSGYSATPDNMYYYVASDKLYVVYPGVNSVNIYPLNSSLKRGKKKTIKINYDCWGGFYAAADGNFYVVVGYSNLKESKNKTVIKVIKYNKNWKKVKTATIKGGASNVFPGIVAPFRSGGCSMDMQGNTLYIHTSRLMFTHSDGLRHQSNISFAVNTKTMKAKATQDTYTSHSFNQYVKFDGDDLYLLDHGDAYPRALKLTVISDYGTESQGTVAYNIFPLKGNTGANYTGCTVGGMEVGSSNILVCGTAHPHYSKIKGVKGSEYSYAYNVYVLVTDKATGKTKVKWLTQNNPKTSKVSINGSRMVKLDDNRYAIMFTSTKDGVSTLNYVVVNEKGQKVYTKKYTDHKFTTGSQPILYKGRVVWVSYEYNESIQSYKNRVHAIPALTK